MFLSDGKVVFSSFIIFFKFSSFVFCTSIIVCSVLFGWVPFGCVVFLFSEVGDSFRFGCFCLLILDVSDIALLSRSLFVFWCVFSISIQKTNFF